jgi:hypothetical protein
MPEAASGIASFLTSGEDEEKIKEAAEIDAQAIQQAGEISRQSFDKASQIERESFANISGIVTPEIEQRRRILEGLEKELTGELEETETGRLQRKIVEKGLAGRGLQRSGVAVGALQGLAAAEAERNIERRFRLAGETRGTQALGIQAQQVSGFAQADLATGAGQASAQSIQEAAFARSGGLRSALARRQKGVQGLAAAAGTGAGIVRDILPSLPGIPGLSKTAPGKAGGASVEELSRNLKLRDFGAGPTLRAGG